MTEKIWSAVCIDPTAGFDITDKVTGITYTDEEAHQQSQEIKSRLTLKPRKIGYYVNK